jgi:hypothetical protein
LGADDYVRKPVDFDVLVAIVSAHLARAPRNKIPRIEDPQHAGCCQNAARDRKRYAGYRQKAVAQGIEQCVEKHHKPTLRRLFQQAALGWNLKPAPLKHLLRNAAAGTIEAVCAAIGQLLGAFAPQECANYFTNQDKI